LIGLTGQRIAGAATTSRKRWIATASWSVSAKRTMISGVAVGAAALEVFEEGGEDGDDVGEGWGCDIERPRCGVGAGCGDREGFEMSIVSFSFEARKISSNSALTSRVLDAGRVDLCDLPQLRSPRRRMKATGRPRRT
jgi:hypothetical protein